MLLAFDTATQTASIAIYNLETEQLLSEWTWQAKRRQTQDLLATVNTMLQQSGIGTQEISALAVTTGPGSFTGVRIGISAAKGIGLGLSSPPKVVGIPTLSVTAGGYIELGKKHSLDLCAYLQAGRGRYNWARAYANLDGEPKHWAPSVEEHSSGTLDEFVAHLKEDTQRPILLLGETTKELQSAVGQIEHVTVVDGVSGSRRAGQLARLAADLIAEGQCTTLSALHPLYLTAP